MDKLTPDKKNKVIKNMQSTVRNLKRRNPKDIEDFKVLVSYFESEFKGNLKRLKESDKEEKNASYEVIDIYLEGFATLKKLKVKFTPQMERVYQYMKKVRTKKG